MEHNTTQKKGINMTQEIKIQNARIEEQYEGDHAPHIIFEIDGVEYLEWLTSYDELETTDSQLAGINLPGDLDEIRELLREELSTLLCDAKVDIERELDGTTQEKIDALEDGEFLSKINNLTENVVEEVLETLYKEIN